MRACRSHRNKHHAPENTIRLIGFYTLSERFARKFSKQIRTDLVVGVVLVHVGVEHHARVRDPDLPARLRSVQRGRHKRRGQRHAGRTGDKATASKQKKTPIYASARTALPLSLIHI